jgi:putative ABC transport system permease protein
MQLVPLLLAILIAYNTANIAMDERRREHATMAAFGAPYRTIMRMAVVESIILGVIATVVGAILGFGLLLYIVEVIFPMTSPDLGLVITFTPTSVLTVIILGVIAVGLAPLLTFRRLRRTDIPSTLRVME